MRNSDDVWDLIDSQREDFIALSDRIWGTPEIAYSEFKSVAEHIAMLEQQGFRVMRDVAGIPTAVIGEAGEDGPVIAILGEYDALPGLSQEAGLDEPKPVLDGGHGHGCGHNYLGSAAMLAAVGVRDWLKKSGIKGRVRYYGCPAEEGGAAKSFMVRAGAFDDVDIAISWHPDSFTRVAPPLALANTRVDFTFTGRAAHAAASPHLGRSALDAVELMNVGVNYLREHVPSDSRIHYAMLDSGGVAPNVVQARAVVRYAIRAPELPAMFDLIRRVTKVAEGAALMTETQMESRVVSAVSNLLANEPLEAAMGRVFDRLGPVQFDAADREYAARIQKTLSPDHVPSSYASIGMEPTDAPLCDFVVPREGVGKPMGSTDVGDVSWVVPTVQARVATFAIGTPLHTWQVTAQGKSPAAHKGFVHAAKVMASTAIEALLDPTIITAAKADLKKRAGAGYVSPLPANVQPPLKFTSSN
ncbi:MAG TPA: M20 family metallopeptidase [Devosia sp.]|nr:M20 family metallopeptidase [Devosia sp.]